MSKTFQFSSVKFELIYVLTYCFTLIGNAKQVIVTYINYAIRLTPGLKPALEKYGS